MVCVLLNFQEKLELILVNRMAQRGQQNVGCSSSTTVLSPFFFYILNGERELLFSVRSLL